MGLFSALTNPSTLMGAGLIGAGVMTGNPALVGGGIGMSAGGVKAGLYDEPRAKKARESAVNVEAIKTKYSPWTGQTGNVGAAMVNTPLFDSLGQGIDYGITGASIGKQVGAATPQGSPTNYTGQVPGFNLSYGDIPRFNNPGINSMQVQPMQYNSGISKPLFNVKY